MNTAGTNLPNPQPPSSTHKKCPFCAEVICFEAKLCRFCNRGLRGGELIATEAPIGFSAPPAVPSASPNPQALQPAKPTSKFFKIVLGLSILCLLGIGLRVFFLNEQQKQSTDSLTIKHQLEAKVKDGLEQEYKMKIRSVELVHEGGNKYKGVVENDQGNRGTVEVIHDGDSLTWQVQGLPQQ